MGITTKSDIGWQRRFLCGSELIWCNLIESGRSETGYGRRTLICSGYRQLGYLYAARWDILSVLGGHSRD
jgi:hypothetical protein